MAAGIVQGGVHGRKNLWPLVALLAGAVVLLLIGVGIALRAAQQPETSFPANSPEGTVTSYLRFLQAGQVDQAYTLAELEMGPPYNQKMTREEFHQRMDNWSQTPHRVTLIRSNTSGDTASVLVEIASFHAEPFGSPDFTSRQTFTLKQRDGAWIITGPSFMAM